MKRLLLLVLAVGLLAVLPAVAPAGAATIVNKVVAEQEQGGFLTTGGGGLDVSHTCLPGTRPFVKLSKRWNARPNPEHIPDAYYYIRLEGERFPWSPTSGTFSKEKKHWPDEDETATRFRPPHRSVNPNWAAFYKPSNLTAWVTEYDIDNTTWVRLSGPDGGKITNIAVDSVVGQVNGDPWWNAAEADMEEFNEYPGGVQSLLTQKAVYGCEESP